MAFLTCFVYFCEFIHFKVPYISKYKALPIIGRFRLIVAPKMVLQLLKVAFVYKSHLYFITLGRLRDFRFSYKNKSINKVDAFDELFLVDSDEEKS